MSLPRFQHQRWYSHGQKMKRHGWAYGSMPRDNLSLPKHGYFIWIGTHMFNWNWRTR